MGSHRCQTKPFLALLLLHIFLLHVPSYAWSETADDSQWQTLETKYTLIHYQTSEDLEKLKIPAASRTESSTVRNAATL